MGGEEDTEREAQGPKPHEEQSSRPRTRTRARSETHAKNSKVPLPKNKTNAPRSICSLAQAPARLSLHWRWAHSSPPTYSPYPRTLRGREHVVVLGPLRYLYIHIHTLPRADVQYERRGVPGVDGSEDVRVSAWHMRGLYSAVKPSRQIHGDQHRPIGKRQLCRCLARWSGRFPF
jgi:hypothetical protein